MPFDRRPTIFAYVEQSRAIRDTLSGFTSGPLDVVQVDGFGHTIKGHNGGVFVNLTEHPCQPPARLWEELRAQGFIIWSIDESHMRGRMAQIISDHERAHEARVACAAPLPRNQPQTGDGFDGGTRNMGGWSPDAGALG